MLGLFGTLNLAQRSLTTQRTGVEVAGQNLANPSGLLMGAIMMLVHIGQTNTAERIHNA